MSALVVAGDVSGTCTLQAPSAAGSTVLTLPVIATDTLAGIAATQTLTNKTLTSPVLTTPALGTPASGVLTNCTGVPASALPAGSVLQVVQGTFSTFISTTSASATDTGLTATITPTSASSKILVLVNGSGYSSATTTIGKISLVRTATTIITFNNIYAYSTATAGVNGYINTAYLDSPSTTSATVYKVQWLRDGGAGTMYLNNTTSTSTIILMEIAG